MFLCLFHGDHAWKKKITVDLLNGSQEHAKVARTLLQKMGDALTNLGFGDHSKEFKVGDFKTFLANSQNVHL